jgi:hypothetical protein
MIWQTNSWCRRESSTTAKIILPTGHVGEIGADFNTSVYSFYKNRSFLQTFPGTEQHLLYARLLCDV